MQFNTKSQQINRSMKASKLSHKTMKSQRGGIFAFPAGVVLIKVKAKEYDYDSESALEGGGSVDTTGE